MKRTTIVLPDELRQRIKRIAAERGQSMAQFIREAVEEKAHHVRPKPKSVGMAASGYTDTADRAGEIEYEPDPWR